MVRRKGNGSDASATPWSQRQRTSTSKTREPKKESRLRQKQRKRQADLDNIPPARVDGQPQAKPHRCLLPTPVTEKKMSIKAEIPVSGSNRRPLLSEHRKSRNVEIPTHYLQAAKAEHPRGCTPTSHQQPKKNRERDHPERRVTDGIEVRHSCTANVTVRSRYLSALPQSGNLVTGVVLPWAVDPGYVGVPVQLTSFAPPFLFPCAWYVNIWCSLSR